MEARSKDLPTDAFGIVVVLLGRTLAYQFMTGFVVYSLRSHGSSLDLIFDIIPALMTSNSWLY